MPKGTIAKAKAESGRPQRTGELASKRRPGRINWEKVRAQRRADAEYQSYMHGKHLAVVHLPEDYTKSNTAVVDFGEKE